MPAETIHFIDRHFLGTTARGLTPWSLSRSGWRAPARGVVPTTGWSMLITKSFGTAPNFDVHCGYSTHGGKCRYCMTLSGNAFGHHENQLFQSTWIQLRARVVLTGTAAKAPFDLWVSFSEERRKLPGPLRSTYWPTSSRACAPLRGEDRMMSPWSPTAISPSREFPHMPRMCRDPGVRTPTHPLPSQ
jgi:hypothetical protein